MGIMEVQKCIQAEILIYRACERSVMQREPIESFLFEFFEACFLCVGDNQNANKMLDAVLKKCESLLSYVRKQSIKTTFEYTGRKRPGTLALIPVVQDCYKFQVDDPDLVENMLKTIHYFQGDSGLKKLFKRRHDLSPESLCRLKRSVGKRPHSFVGYLNRVATTKKMIFSGQSLDDFHPPFVKGSEEEMKFFLCRNLFHFSYRAELKLKRSHSNPPRGRDLANLIFDFLPLLVRNFDWKNWSSEQENEVVDEISRFQAVHERILEEFQFYFRTIPDPYVSIKELKDLADSYDAHPLSCVLGLKLYQQLLPEISEEQVTTPRALSHLSRCQIRKCLYIAWKLPEETQALHFLTSLPKPLPVRLVHFVGLHESERDLKQQVYEKCMRNN